MDNFSRTQIVRKAVIPTRGGVVAAAHRRAAEVGAAVLDAGGDSVDAAVAVSFAIGVVEPWMSGPAAGGAMVLWRADEGRAWVAGGGGQPQRRRWQRRRRAGRGLRHGRGARAIRPPALARPARA